MRPLVFAQATDAHIPIARIVNNARSYFPIDVEILSQRAEPGGPSPETTTVQVRVELDGASACFQIRSRHATRDDYIAAEEAEARGSASGMSLLARRCDYCWLMEPDDDADEATIWSLCALLASVALGPVLPDDHSTLMGVRGATERARELLGKPALGR